jgi:hypothetical protein
MSIHSYHPAGLHEDCERCISIAANPFREMDALRLCELYNDTIVFIEIGYPRSKRNAIEMAAMRIMEKHIINQRQLETAMAQAQVIAG